MLDKFRKNKNFQKSIEQYEEEQRRLSRENAELKKEVELLRIEHNDMVQEINRLNKIILSK